MKSKDLLSVVSNDNASIAQKLMYNDLLVIGSMKLDLKDNNNYGY